MRKSYGYHFTIIGVVSILTVWLSDAKPYANTWNAQRWYAFLTDTVPADSSEADTLLPYSPSRRSTFQPKDRMGDPITFGSSPSPLLLKDPASLTLDAEIDTAMNYTIYEKMGDINYRPTTTMSFEEFSAYEEKKMIKDYWKDRAAELDGESAMSGRQLVPTLYFSPIFDRIFGGSYVNIEPSGFVTLDFGVNFPRTYNPGLTIRQQRGGGGFKFDQQISMNVVGKVGEKLTVAANFDNNNTFDFENNMKVEYTGFEEDIIKKIEIGNVSLPINNSLISGGQNLFGIKTQMQFGKLYVTSILSNQRGKADNIALEGGSQLRDFEIRGSEYDENRHFFLSHYFRDNYERWLRNSPQITSGVTISRVEVYVINRNQDTENLRSVLGVMDLGEADTIYRDKPRFVIPSKSGSPSDNQANNVYSTVLNLNKSVDQIANQVEQQLNYVKSTDYEINVARKLEEGSEYVINKQLGYISLLRKLQNDDLLAVAYEYSVNGATYKVGELTEDYQGRPATEVAILKLLRPNNINRSIPSWDLMMKNIYNLNATQVSREDFQLRIIYRDDRSGVDNPSLHESSLKNKQLLQLANLDRLNPNNDQQPDGNFDFIEGVTINTRNGEIIFPVLEPFGKTLENSFLPDEQGFKNKYVFNELYRSTKAEAELNATKNKFFLVGKLQAGSSNEIILPGIGISPGSVRVTAGNTALTEGLDYTVDYQLGRVVIINEGVLNSGKKIDIAYEKADLFTFQQRSLVGTRFDYKVGDKLNVGATYLRYNERPNVTRNSIGTEPMRNVLWGFDLNYSTDWRFLTKMIDALPLVETKEMSSISFSGEFAQLRPGTSNFVDGEGTSYIDDFENSATPFNLASPALWRLAATPQTDDSRFDKSFGGDTLGLNYKRAKLAWYSIDNVFYYGGNNRPDNITEEDLYNHYIRKVIPQELFQRDREQVNINIPVFDLAYYPAERGPYNYNRAEIGSNGRFQSDLRQNWAGITRAITSDVDFDKTNIEYIEFWMMDPFISGTNGVVQDGSNSPQNNTTGGELYFNLGNISEDVMRDKRHAFENGLPPDYNPASTFQNAWGRVTRQQYLNNAFDNSAGSRENQDIGFDGLKDADEAAKFSDFVRNVPAATDDPSGDNYSYFLSSSLDQAGAGVLERYKNINGLDGNSPLANNDLQFTQSTSQLPDNEDLNGDNIINDLESYYEYKLELRPNSMVIGQNYIVDKVTSAPVDGSNEQVDWYLFRVPIRQPDKVYGSIDGFKTIRFLRTYLTGFTQPVVLRMAKFQLVGSQWRKYKSLYNNSSFDEAFEDRDPNFTVSVVGFEENGSSGDNKVAYTLPPGIIRDRDNTSVVERRVNEQSLQLCVDNMEYKDARAVYKNVTLDLINYGRLKMFIHAQSQNVTETGELRAFVRLGTDFEENYYEIELPLEITPYGTVNPTVIWPESNELDISFGQLYELKARRQTVRGQRNDALINDPFSYAEGKYKLTIRGRPDLSSVQVLMIGVRNPEGTTNRPKSVCIWANELRVTDFDQTAGWAANASLNTKLADVASITASTRHTTVGFGNIQQKISERTREETTEFDLSANITADKFLPAFLGLKVPMYLGYQTTIITPFFDPRDPDIPLQATLNAYDNAEDRRNYLRLVQDRSERRSINFTNVRKVKIKADAPKHFYDVENLSFSYAYSEQVRSNFTTESYILRNYKGAVAYNYTAKDISIEPFKKAKGLKSPYLKILKEANFSPLPNTLGFRYDLDRRFVRTQYRNADLSIDGIEPFFEKQFNFNRNYNWRWGLTKALTVDYTANVMAIVDESPDDIDTQFERNEITNNLKSLGRMKNFNQTIGANYRLPLDKIPFTDWISADARYAAGYLWESGSYNAIDSLSQINIFGHDIQNNRDQSINGKIDMVKLYNKVKILKTVNTPPRKGKGDTLWIHQPKGRFAKNTLKLLMAVKSINGTYSVKESTRLPGFRFRPYVFGLDSGLTAPGIPFLLGDQDPSIRFTAADPANNWLVRSQEQTDLFAQNRTVDLSLRANIEPFTDVKIQLDARKTKSANYTELFKIDSLGQDFQSLNINRAGSYTITTMMINTAFDRTNSELQSNTFAAFERNLITMQQRLGTVEGVPYDTTAQDVIIPAFLAAYTGQSANTVSTSPVPTIPLPNWRIDYAGLSKIEALKEVFTSVNLTHAYTSTYNIASYNRAAIQGASAETVDLSNSIEKYPRAIQENGVLRPIYIINAITLRESFSPLIGINVKTKSKVTARVEYKRERALNLSLSNVQIQENLNEDWVVDIGYTKSNLKLPFRSKGRIITLKNEITFRCNFTIRDSQTIQRQLGQSNVITSGAVNLQLRPTINYVINKRINLQMYFERTVNEPSVSTSFRRTNTAGGVQLRFNLAQ
ncbi:cell surface protein SprA [Cytophagales bacterium LB-30]|uniref:Cell surface protein SprA n=1 Tax=Shiella aurantiaca TaxID=3058365 RepID=A0ABT8F378_9BACT|nr:cell surface protein SprA [Shiella aurantiaca]MDN4164694.1 cell surface protein SprA [Shiella aurantiaca]